MERYSRDHVWIRPEGAAFRVGISPFAQGELGDVAFVELPAVGRHVARGEPACTIESLKSTSEVYAPVAGTITGVNERLRDELQAATVNRDPLGDGWLFEMTPDDPAEVQALLTPAQYQGWLSGTARPDAH
jgi:glycine cleavage system H protein